MSQVMPASDDADDGRKRSSSDAVDSQTLHDTVAVVNDALVAAGRTDLVPRFAALVRLLPLYLHQQPPVKQPQQQQLPQPCTVDAAVTANSPSSRYTEAARLQAGRAVKATDWWTLYPHELQAKILLHAGPLTQLLCGYLDVANMDDAAKRALWIDAFKMDWQGDLALLPNADLDVEDFVHVSSRSMYHRLWERFPYYDCDKYRYDNIRVGMCMVPMRHMWLDSVPLMSHEYLAKAAIRGDCARFFVYMTDKKLVPLELVLNFGYRRLEYFVDIAAWYGSLGIVKMLSARGASATSNAMNGAAENGHLHVVQWLHQYRTEGCTEWAMDHAARNGHLDVVQWLHQHRTEGCSEKAMDYASNKGHLAIVQWLLANRTEGFTYWAVSDAANDDIARLLARSMTAAQRTAMIADAEGDYTPDLAVESLICWSGLLNERFRF